jgi:hypothetical protein
MDPIQLMHEYGLDVASIVRIGVLPLCNASRRRDRILQSSCARRRPDGQWSQDVTSTDGHCAMRAATGHPASIASVCCRYATLSESNAVVSLALAHWHIGTLAHRCPSSRVPVGRRMRVLAGLSRGQDTKEHLRAEARMGYRRLCHFPIGTVSARRLVSV